MRRLFAYGLIVAGLALLQPATANAQFARPGQRFSFGYPSVAEAYAALSARPDMTFTDDDGWLRAVDPRTSVLWTFSRPGHPAHPVGVRRQYAGSGANVRIVTNIRCEAEKVRCDAVEKYFRKQNSVIRRMYRESFAARVAQRDYQPTPAQSAAARQAMDAFFAALDAGRFDDAYALFDESTRTAVPRDRFLKLETALHEQAGTVAGHGEPVVSWHRDPRGFPAGIYAVFDVDGRSAGGSSWSDTLVTRRRDDGGFAVLRHERNVMALPGPISVVGAH